MGHRQTELGEGDWRTLAEEAYKAFVAQLEADYVVGTRVPWEELPTTQKSAWVAAVKETAPRIKHALRLVG